MSAEKNIGATDGPRTSGGKERSRWNARKSGLQSKVLAVSKEDIPEFDSMRSALRDDLQPESPVQEILFDEIVAAAWQMKQTTGFVQAARRFAPEEQSATERPPASYPYPFSAGEIRSRLKILDELQEAIRQDQFVHPRYEQMITRLFGPEFWTTLTKWEPPSRVTLFSQKLAAVVHERSQIFNHELPIEPPTEEEKSTALVADYKARTQMIDKLVDLKKNYLLLDLHRVHGVDGEASGAEPSGRLDLALRYHTKARRDFYRALEEYEKYSGK